MIENVASSKSHRWGTAWWWCYWGGVVVVFAWAACHRFALPLDPIADPDTWGYLAPALRKLVGGEFAHTDGRNFIYPAFVFVLLRLFGDFRAIVITQHLLGLMAGVILFLTWRRSRVFVQDSRLSCQCHDTIGLFAAAIFLLAGEPNWAEMQLRPEGVSAFFISVNLYLAVRLIRYGFIEKRPGGTVSSAIGISFAALLLASTKPSFGLFAAVALLPVGILFFRRGWIRQKMVIAAGATFLAALLCLPEHFLSRQDEASRTTLPTTLFVIHGDLIRDQMAADLQLGAETPFSRERLERVHDQLATEIAKSIAAHPTHFPSLGFCPDYLFHDRSSIDAQMRLEFGNDISALCSFYRYYYWRIWRERPFLMIKKIFRQMALFYSQMCPAYNRDKFVHLEDGYGNGAATLALPSYRELWKDYPPAVQWVAQMESLARSVPPIRQSMPLRMALSILAGAFRPLLLGALIICGGFLCQRQYRRRLGWLAVWAAFLFLCSWACCLEVAIVHSLENRRYSSVQAILTILAQFTLLWLLCEIALENRTRVHASR